MFLCFLRYIFEHFEPPKTFLKTESFKANFFPVSMKQGSVKVVFEEALVIFARALDLIPNFTLLVILSESRKKASVNSNYFNNCAFSACRCDGNLVWRRLLVEAGIAFPKTLQKLYDRKRVLGVG